MAPENENDLPTPAGGNDPTKADSDAEAPESTASEAVSKSSDPPTEDGSPDSVTLAQDDIDRILAAQINAEEVASQSESDEPLAAQGGLDDPLASGKEDEPLATPGMDDALVDRQDAALGPQADGEDQELAKIESLLTEIDSAAHALDPEEVSPPDDTLGIDESMVDSLLKQAQEVDEPAAKSSPDPDPMLDLHVPEPAAAETRPDAPPEIDEDIAFPPNDGDQPVDADSDRPHKKKSRRLPGFPAAWFQRHGNKTITSVAAGLVAAIATYSLLAAVFSGEGSVPDGPEEAGASAVAAVVQTARDLVMQGQPGEALVILDEALEGVPDTEVPPDAAYWRARALYDRAGNPPDMLAASLAHNAIEDFGTSAPGDPRVPETLLWKADLYERSEIPLASLDVYKNLIANFSNLPAMDSILLKAGKTALEVGRTPEAFDFLRRLTEDYPGSVELQEAKLLLGDAYAATGSPEEAARLYAEVAASVPRSRTDPGIMAAHSRTVASAYTRLARIAYDAGKYDEAIELLETRLQTATTADGNEQIYMLLAKSYQMAGKLTEAERKLRELLDFFPESETTPEAYAALADILASQGKQEEAMRLASEAANRFPEEGSVLRARADLMKQAGDLRGAAQALVAAEETGAREPAALLEAGRLFHRMNELTDAEFVLDKLLAEYPNAPEAFDGAVELASVQFDRGMAGPALERMMALMESAAGSPRELPVTLELGRMYRDLGLDDRAAEFFKRVAGLTSEPGVLAETALALFDAEEWSEGTAVANRVEADALTADQAYAFDMAYGRALLQLDSNRGIQLMEMAFANYPDLRQEADERALMDAYLATGMADSAKAMIEEMEGYAAGHPIAIPRLHGLAVQLADHYYRKGQLDDALAAYGKAQGSELYAGEATEWAAFQRANILHETGNLGESLEFYDQIAQSQSPWADEAGVRAELVRMEQKLDSMGKLPAAPAVG